jgi:hypothetical protein
LEPPLPGLHGAAFPVLGVQKSFETPRQMAIIGVELVEKRKWISEGRE